MPPHFAQHQLVLWRDEDLAALAESGHGQIDYAQKNDLSWIDDDGHESQNENYFAVDTFL